MQRRIDMLPKTYDNKLYETIKRWAKSKERDEEIRRLVFRIENMKIAVMNIGIWTAEDLIVRLVISVDLFYRYPYTTDAIRRRIEMLEEKIFYISLDGEPKMMTDMTWGRRIRKNEIRIDPQDIFRLMKEISRHMPETAKEDLNRLVEKLERYSRYAEC